ncbi:MAG: IS3 family transposase [Clostridiales bacterium]|nr:IS3 family transposase [Clostridiales bacterium]
MSLRSCGCRWNCCKIFRQKLKCRVIERFRGEYSVEAMCEVFEVSQSGYYAWQQRQERTTKDQRLADLIVECQKRCKQTYGMRRWIRRQTGKEVNCKAILRLMRKLDLLSVVRCRRPCRRCQQAIYKYSNLLNRRFDQPRPNQFWGADITCIPFPSGMLYMGAVLDLCGKVVQNWKIGSEMSSSLVTNTIREALQQEKVTDKVYFDLTQVYHASPSMFSHGCPCDNAAVENFFGALKTECLYRARFSLRAEVERLVTESVHFYNFECISLKNGLTPLEIRGKTA